MLQQRFLPLMLVAKRYPFTAIRMLDLVQLHCDSFISAVDALLNDEVPFKRQYLMFLEVHAKNDCDFVDQQDSIH